MTADLFPTRADHSPAPAFIGSLRLARDVVAVLVVSTAACRQTDRHPLLATSGTESDLSGDRLAVAGSEATTSKDFVDEVF